MRIAPMMCLLVLGCTAYATDWYVDPVNGDAGNDGLTPSTAKKALGDTWQNKARSGDTVWIIGAQKISSTINLNKDGLVIAGFGETSSISLKDGFAVPLLTLSADSVVSNLTFVGGVGPTAKAGLNSWEYPAAGVEISKGRLTHCKVTQCRPAGDAYHCSAVRITGTGIVADCDIFGNSAGKLNDSYAAGVDLKSENARLLDSRVHDCRGRAAAVFVEKGLVEGCAIYCNTNYPASELSGGVAAGSGAGLRVDGDTWARVSRCRIYGNCGYGNGGGLWLRNGAIVENCLVYENEAATSGGAIYSNSGNSTVRFCNIGGNRAGDGAAIFVNGGAPVFQNNIICGNGTDPTKQIRLQSTSAPFTCNLLPVAMTGEGNLVATKSPYVDAAQGNYMTADDSEGIDRAQSVSDVDQDLLGTLRPQDGGTGLGSVCDIGCVERESPEILTSPVVYLNPEGAGIPPYDTAEKGAHTLAAALLAVDWTARGHGEVRVCCGDYAPASVEATVSLPVLICGWDPVSGTASESKVTLKGTSLLLDHAQASVSGIDFSGRCAEKDYCVKVRQGVVTNCVIRDFGYEIAKDSVNGEGKPVFSGGALVFAGSDVAPQVCRTVDSVISNCVVTLASDFVLKYYQFGTIGAGVAFRSAAGATLERCLVSDCSAAGDGGGIAVESYSARIVDCEVTRCRASIRDGDAEAAYVVRGGGIYLKGTYGDLSCVSGCTIHHNYANGSGGGIFTQDNSGPKRIWNCRITDNEVYTYAGSGLRIEQSDSSVAVVNCLIADNSKIRTGGGSSGVYLKGGKLINCTISGNRGGACAAGLTVYARTADDTTNGRYASAVRNTIVWGNAPEVWDQSSRREVNAGAGNAYSHLVIPASEAVGLDGTAIVTADPKLKAATYELRRGSPAIDAGESSCYNVENFGDRDLAGNDRFFKGRTIDCGCFECGLAPLFAISFR